jgi:cytochrome c biogenesis protein CcdA
VSGITGILFVYQGLNPFLTEAIAAAEGKTDKMMQMMSLVVYTAGAAITFMGLRSVFTIMSFNPTRSNARKTQ